MLVLVCTVFVARVSVWCVARLGTRDKNRVRSKRLRVYRQNARTLIVQARGYADLERHVPELYEWVQKNNEAAPEMRCAILDVVSW